jgi:hypothetical protein
MSDPNQVPHHNAPHPPPQRPLIAPGARPAVAPPSHGDKDLEPITLVEDRLPTGANHPAPPPPKKIMAFGPADTHKHHNWKRQPHKTGTGAIRVKTFHGKYSEQGVEYLDNAINEWLDANPDVEVKFVTPTVTTFEGKIRENALVLNLWY